MAVDAVLSPSAGPRPWQALPADLAALLCAAIPSIADEVVDVLGPAIPAYRTLEGPFGRDVIRAVADALHDFAGVIEHRPPTLGAGRALYVAVGERWWRSGHSLDDLQAGYHLGARVVWRRIAAVATDNGEDAATIAVLADSLFAYLDEIAAASVEGFVASQAAAAGEVERRRQQLVATLIAGPPADRATLERAATGAAWTLPRTVAVVAIAADHRGLRNRRLPADVLVGTADGIGCLVLPDPAGSGRARRRGPPARPVAGRGPDARRRPRGAAAGAAARPRATVAGSPRGHAAGLPAPSRQRPARRRRPACAPADRALPARSPA
jgi:hypothetical protein